MERRILPESIIRRHIRELDLYSSSGGIYLRRSLRTERALDDPVREMEGMLVDEYGRFEFVRTECFALFQFDTLKYSSIPNADVIIFLAFRLYCTNFFSSSSH